MWDTSAPLRSSVRGQAFTLEGLVSSIVILTAVLFGIQAVVLSPTAGGDVDPATRSDLKQEATDVLTIVANNETFGLDEQIRFWNANERSFAGAQNPNIGYGHRTLPRQFGTLLRESFTRQGRQFNVELRYRDTSIENRTRTTRLAFRGVPTDDAVVATYPVVLYDNQTFVSPESRSVELHEYDTNSTDADDGYYPIPNVVQGPIYNVVEVRVIVW
jgi:hypothetical protein